MKILARSLAPEHIAISIEESDGVNKKTILHWCDVMFGGTSHFNDMVELIQEGVQHFTGESMPEDLTIEEVALQNGITSRDLLHIWSKSLDSLGFS